MSRPDSPVATMRPGPGEGEDKLSNVSDVGMEERSSGAALDEKRGRDGATQEPSAAPTPTPDRTDRDTPQWTALKQCAEVVSLCFVRDAMGRGMEPIMGYLKWVAVQLCPMRAWHQWPN